jgi:hypothetical protein
VAEPRRCSIGPRAYDDGVLSTLVGILLAIVVLGLVACPRAIAQVPPLNVMPPGVTGTPVDGATLQADPGKWIGTEPIEFAFQWARCVGADCTAVPGATGASYVLSPADVGAQLQVTVTASNEDGSNTGQSSLTDVVAPAPPQNTAPPVVVGTPRDGQILTASMGAWSGTPPLDFAVRWERCSATGPPCSPIPGAASASYVLSSRDVGSTLRVVVSASNAAETRTALSAVTGIVAASPLISVERPAILGLAQVGRQLTATTGRWAPNGPIDFLYRWLRCRADGSDCLAIPGATRAHYDVRQLDLGSRLRVRVTAISDAGSAARESALTRVVTGVLAAEAPQLMRPFPRVRIRGYFTSSCVRRAVPGSPCAAEEATARSTAAHGVRAAVRGSAPSSGPWTPARGS